MAEQPTAPWWATFVAILLTAVVSILGTAYFMGARAPAGTGAPSMSMALAKDVVAYLPHILLLFGVLADAFTYEGVYAIPSGIGLLSIFLNYGMRYFWDLLGNIISKITMLFSGQAGSFPAVSPTVAARQAAQRAPMAGRGRAGEFSGNYDGCEVQGFAWARNPYAPQTLVVTATVFMYYIFDLVNNRGWVNSAATILLFGIFYIAQIAVVGVCGDELTPLKKAFIAFAEGSLFGGVSYAIVQSYAPGRLPSSAMSVFPRKNASELSPGKDGTMVDSAGNPYVCLPNGQCMPDLSTMEARKNFADMAGENLGTGKAAVPSDCPATRPASSTTTQA